MNALQEIRLSDIDMQDIVERPQDYPIELVGACLDVIIEMSRQVRDAKLRIEGHIIADMTAENATKFDIVGHDGVKKVLTIKSGSMQGAKDADMRYREAGFDPSEIGEMVFKPSWSKAKEARKRGGDKQAVIDQIFKAGTSRLEVK